MKTKTEINFLADILEQINKELAKAMRSEFDKQKSNKLFKD